MNEHSQICSRCVLDTSEPTISFDSEGVCNYCNEYDHSQKKETKLFSEDDKLLKAIEKIKQDGVNKEYDCIIGLSGGVDSSYVAFLVKEHGLRPLAVHLDNGWDDELAVKNIENICKILEIDLYTHVINWNEFKDLQMSFLKASVANAEAPTDHAIFASLFNLAVKHKIKWIIDGVNEATEYVRKDTKAGGYRYDDLKHIKAIHNQFGTVKLKTFPMLSIYKKFMLSYIIGIKQFSILNYIDYNKNAAKEFLINKLNWKEYGAKHHESLYTKWHQAVNLVQKFGYDKRRLHLSDLILSGQISRAEAIVELEKAPLSERDLNELEHYVQKKLGLNLKEYNNILNNSPKSYKSYPNDEKVLKTYAEIKNIFKK
jgi:N-acetyl sugar amidotransferase